MLLHIVQNTKYQENKLLAAIIIALEEWDMQMCTEIIKHWSPILDAVYTTDSSD